MTMLADIAPADLIAKLQRLTFGTCDCLTKTPELRFHAENCCYRLAAECVDLLATTPVAGTAPSGAEVRDQVFALCEDTEDRELPNLDFNRGRKFEAKQIRKALGIWHWDATHPAQPTPEGPRSHDDFVRAAVEHHGGKWPDGLTSNVLFFMGAAIQRSEFEAGRA